MKTTSGLWSCCGKLMDDLPIILTFTASTGGVCVETPELECVLPVEISILQVHERKRKYIAVESKIFIFIFLSIFF